MNADHMLFRNGVPKITGVSSKIIMQVVIHKICRFIVQNVCQRLFKRSKFKIILNSRVCGTLM